MTEAIRREILSAPKEVVMSAAEELIQRGFQKGIQEGERVGEQRGLLEGKRSTLTKMLQLKFRTLPASTAARIAHASPEQLDRWVERILVAASIDDVFVAD